MTVQVLIFGAAARAAGADRVAVRLTHRGSDQGVATTAEVLRSLGEQHAALGPALVGARLAVNHQFATADQTIRSTDEVALISLVGGG
ncbi:MAG: MoaD/ThiS family protein [Phycisphaerales bacterium]|nr:MoaD/ThiS family protein [Phycisphaerales bacterium]